MPEEPRTYAVPTPGRGDHAHALVRAALGAVPIVGGPSVELFNWLVTPPLQHRREDWMEKIGAGVERLESEGRIDVEKLRSDERFIDAVLLASQSALRTSSARKREALRNAVLNVTLPGSPDDVLMQIYFNRIDRYTEWHLRVLSLLQNPDQVEKTADFKPDGSLAEFGEMAIPELRGRPEVYDLIWTDLFREGLIDTQSADLPLSGSGLVGKRTTQEGDAFLAFITSPIG